MKRPILNFSQALGSWACIPGIGAIGGIFYLVIFFDYVFFNSKKKALLSLSFYLRYIENKGYKFIFSNIQ